MSLPSQKPCSTLHLWSIHFNKQAKIIQWEEQLFQLTVLGETDIHTRKDEGGALPFNLEKAHSAFRCPQVGGLTPQLLRLLHSFDICPALTMCQGPSWGWTRRQTVLSSWSPSASFLTSSHRSKVTPMLSMLQSQLLLPLVQTSPPLILDWSSCSNATSSRKPSLLSPGRRPYFLL